MRVRSRVVSVVGGDDPSGLRHAVQQQVDLGFSAVKINASGAAGPISTPAALAQVLSRAELAREVLGPARDLALDFHGRLGIADARRVLARLDEVAPLFVE